MLCLTLIGSTPAAVARKKPRLDKASARSSTTTPAPTPSFVQHQTTGSVPIHTAPTPSIIRSRTTSTAPIGATPTSLLTTTLRSGPTAQDAPQPVSATLDALGDDFKRKLLEHFQTEQADHFPFLCQGLLFRGLDDSTAADVALCEQKAPFSFAAVCMSALHRHCTLQKRASQELLASIANVMLLQGRKSLDLLYCLLIVEGCKSRISAVQLGRLTASNRVPVPRHSKSPDDEHPWPGEGSSN